MRLTVAVFLLLTAPFLGALGTEVHDALSLELQGRLSEAREAYRTVLLSKDFGAKPTPESQALQIQLLTKLGHLALDLGAVDEAWDLQLQLRSLATAESKNLAGLLRQRILSPSSDPSVSAPASVWPLLPSPAFLVSSNLQRYWRLQLGAFGDWNHVRTQLDILVEKGWSPWVEERRVGSSRLVAVFVVSHDRKADLAQLTAQGFQPTSLVIDVRS